jgi:hypothetical protein
MQTQYNDPKGQAGSLKAPLGLVPPYAMEQTSWVHKLGADKYGPWNWRETGVCASTYVNAILRHLNAWRDGESLDPESGITHLAHIACSANILMDAEVCGKLQDDRNKRPTNDETEEGSLVVGELLTVSEFADILKWIRGEDEEPPTKHVEDNKPYEDFWGPLDEDTVPEYRVLKKGELIQEGDEFFDEQVGEWKETSIVKAMGIEVEYIDLYRRKVADCDLKEDTVPEYHVLLREGDKLQDGDEVYVGEDHWLPVYVSDWMTPSIVRNGTYRRKITNCDLKPESSIDDECKCGRRKVYHWLYGYICEDCEIKYPDPQP